MSCPSIATGQPARPRSPSPRVWREPVGSWSRRSKLHSVRSGLTNTGFAPGRPGTGFATLVLAALAVPANCAADVRTPDRYAQPDMIELTVNEIRRLINVLLTRPTGSMPTSCAGQTGDADTKRERSESTTPAASSRIQQ